MLEPKKPKLNRLPGKGKYVLCIFNDGDMRVYDRQTVPRDLDTTEEPFAVGHVCNDNKEALILMAQLGRDERWSYAKADMTAEHFLNADFS